MGYGESRGTAASPMYISDSPHVASPPGARKRDAPASSSEQRRPSPVRRVKLPSPELLRRAGIAPLEGNQRLSRSAKLQQYIDLGVVGAALHAAVLIANATFYDCTCCMIYFLQSLQCGNIPEPGYDGAGSSMLPSTAVVLVLE